MIYSVKGKLIEKQPDLLVVECGGVGYGCRTTTTTINSVGSLGEEVFLYTVLNVREDAMELFGFSSKSELECFRLLTSVSGIGPKAGLALLSDFTPDRLLLTIAAEDTKTLTRTKGIGAKAASRIVVELKDKVAGVEFSGTMPTTASKNVASVQKNSELADALEALETLGYSQGDVAPILSKLDSTLNASELIRLTLQEIGKERK